MVAWTVRERLPHARLRLLCLLFQRPGPQRSQLPLLSQLRSRGRGRILARVHRRLHGSVALDATLAMATQCRAHAATSRAASLAARHTKPASTPLAARTTTALARAAAATPAWAPTQPAALATTTLAATTLAAAVVATTVSAAALWAHQVKRRRPIGSPRGTFGRWVHRGPRPIGTRRGIVRGRAGATAAQAARVRTGL